MVLYIVPIRYRSRFRARTCNLIVYVDHPSVGEAIREANWMAINHYNLKLLPPTDDIVEKVKNIAECTETDLRTVERYE